MASFFAEVVAVVERTQRWQFLLIDFIELQYLSCLPPHTVRFNMTLPIFLECFMPRFCWFCDNSFPPKLSLQQIGITQVVAVSSTKLYKVASRLKIMFCQNKYVLMELSFWLFKPRGRTFKYFSWKLQYFIDVFFVLNILKDWNIQCRVFWWKGKLYFINQIHH